MASESASLSSSVPSPSLQNLTKAKIEDFLLHHGADALLEAILVPEVRVAREPVVLLFEVVRDPSLLSFSAMLQLCHYGSWAQIPAPMPL